VSGENFGYAFLPEAHHQAVMQSNDIDLGSSGPVIRPDSVGPTAHPHLMIATGKVGVVYLLDQIRQTWGSTTRGPIRIWGK
jgi:hypothetical protein